MTLASSARKNSIAASKAANTSAVQTLLAQSQLHKASSQASLAETVRDNKREGLNNQLCQLNLAIIAAETDIQHTYGLIANTTDEVYRLDLLLNQPKKRERIADLEEQYNDTKKRLRAIDNSELAAPQPVVTQVPSPPPMTQAIVLVDPDENTAQRDLAIQMRAVQRPRPQRPYCCCGCGDVPSGPSSLTVSPYHCANSRCPVCYEYCLIIHVESGSQTEGWCTRCDFIQNGDGDEEEDDE